MRLNLRKFDISTIPDDKVVVFIGMRNTGKSYLVRDLLYHHRDIPIGTVISATESANKFYSHMVPSLFIHEKISANILQNVLKRQQIIMKRINKEEKKNGKSNIDPRAFIILDDCMYNKKWVNDETIRALFMNGRHYKIMFILTMQYVLGIPPNLRSNVDYVFILRENNINNRKRIYDNYAGVFPTFDVFSTCMDQCTENYECLVIHNNAKSNKIEDQVFWYKAENHDDFRIGAREFWQWQDECENDDSSDDEEMFDASNFIKKKGPSIKIKKKKF
jgi:hypothetical protein